MVNGPLISRYPLKRGLDSLAQPVARRRRGLIERDLAFAPKQFAECPVRQAVTGGRATTLQDRRLWVASRSHVEELPHQATLADARRPGYQRQAWAIRIHRLMEEAGERLDLLFAADHSDLHAFASIERVGQRADNLSYGDRRRLPADLARLRLAEDERVAGGRVGSLPGEDRPRLGHLLQPSGDIDLIAGHDALVGSGHHLAGVDTDANRQADAMLSLELRIEVRQPLEHLAGGSQRPLSVILTHDRNAEGGHNRVAHELLDRPSPGLDRRGHDGEESLKEDPPPLGVKALAQSGRPGDVRKEDRDELALLQRP